MRIGVVSDTHGHMEFSRQAVEALGRFTLDAVIHCGDIGGPGVIPLFDQWPTHFVFGNVDHYLENMLRKTIATAEQTCHGLFGALELAGKRVAFLHSDDQSRFRATIDCQEYDLVCYGHTHVAEEHAEGRTRVLNPGAVYRANPRSIAIVTLPELDIEFVHLN